MTLTTSSSTRSRPRPRAAAAAPAAIPAAWCVGVVAGDPVDGRWTVRSGDLVARARPALGCLLQPQAGDSVACLRIAPDEVWIMGVLEREGPGAALVELPADATVRAAAGTLTLSAPAVALRGDRIDLTAEQARMTVGTGEVVGRQFRLTGSVFKIVGSVLSTVMDRVQHFSRHYARTTEGLDRVKATHIECEAQQLLQLSAEHAVLNSEKLLKARAGQIHFG
ncbi:MAG: DUF3540 domain-containing protein [Comamonadaceae bacterium]|nr:MAG: DUF3540 domain-containing protein [Comamonadaceae bacterium]